MQRPLTSFALIGFGLLAIGSTGAIAITNHLEARRSLQARASALTGGEPRRGEQLVVRYGCGGCHSIAGVPQASGKVGPPLSGIGSRVYLAGRLHNRPDNLIRWIQNPRAIDAQTAMPALGIRTEEARDIAAFLYTLN